MRKLVNGWTAERVLAQVKKYNDGAKAIKEGTNNICTYQAKNGNRCFVGAFIPDDHAALNSNFEVSDLLAEHHDLASLMPFDETDDLKDFQLSHDMANVEFEGKTYAALTEFLKDCE